MKYHRDKYYQKYGYASRPTLSHSKHQSPARYGEKPQFWAHINQLLIVQNIMLTSAPAFTNSFLQDKMKPN